MIKLGIILSLLVCWFFATMLKVNDESNSHGAFFVKSFFFWAAMAMAYALGAMN